MVQILDLHVHKVVRVASALQSAQATREEARDRRDGARGKALSEDSNLELNTLSALVAGAGRLRLVIFKTK